MSATSKLILWLLSLAIVLGALFGSYRYGRHVEGLVRDRQELKLMAVYVEKVKQSEEQHDKDQATINRLATGSRRVRVVFPLCPKPGKDSDAASRVLSDRMGELFAGFQARVGGIIEKCDQINIDAIRANKQ